MKKILLIATGGTIASKYTKEGLSPQISAEELLEYIPAADEFCTIDTIQPFLRIAAAALEDKPLPISHPAELFLGNLPYTHNFISSIVIACSWAISCWVSFRKLSTPGISERLRPLSQATPI